MFDRLSPEQIREFLLEQGFLRVRQLEDSSWIGVLRLAFTTSVCMDIDEFSPFRLSAGVSLTQQTANHFFETAVDYDEAPTKRDSLKGHRYRGEPLLREKDEFGFDKW